MIQYTASELVLTHTNTHTNTHTTHTHAALFLSAMLHREGQRWTQVQHYDGVCLCVCVYVQTVPS